MTPIRTATPPSVAAGALAILLAAACAAQPEQPEPHTLVGCHYFEHDQIAADLRLPWGVQLLDEPLQAGWPIERRGDVMRALTLTGQATEDHPFGYWRATAPDSVEIGYPAGGGLLLQLRLHDGRLQGTARPLGDAVTLEQGTQRRADRPVALIRARCPDE